MRKEGTIVRWDDAKGFGFIRSGAVGQDVFVHVRDYSSSAGEAPRQGLRVTFEDIQIGAKGPRALAVRPAADPVASKARQAVLRSARNRETRAAPPTGRIGAWGGLPFMVVYGLALTWLVSQRQLPLWVLPASILLNLVTFAAYWKDKYAAQTGRWRTPEDTLHLWSLIGGWVGAWFAQQMLRHKSSKASFRTVYWFTVMTHCVAVMGILWFLRTA